MTAGLVGVSPGWLQLREAADAAARATDLVQRVLELLPDGDAVCIHDLGCGTGAMGRWLAPRLTGPQHWIGYDWDPDLLAQAATDEAYLERRLAEASAGHLIVSVHHDDLLARPRRPRWHDRMPG
jgi:trans-aconitate methyltransferase